MAGTAAFPSTSPIRPRACAARRLRGTLLAVLLLLPAGPAYAETLLTGFAGGAFGGATDRTRGTYGGALGFLGNGVVGFELEFAATPDFFGESDEGVFSTNNVLTGMGSLLLALPGGPLRLYAAAGAGVMKTKLEDPDRLLEFDSNDFGINVGGGLLVNLGDHVALRGDVRYFRDLQDDEPDGDFDLDLGTVDYWRAVGGLTFRF
ncbi:MAG TPA: outer membrane beta-barrel protein [Vicinamibacteria bacterium]|nr:outer membrane beta-barrel protein [Vicinamibacteria bacterium]